MSVVAASEAGNAARPANLTDTQAAALLLTADDITSMYSRNDANDTAIRDNGTAMYDVTTSIPAKIKAAIPTLRRSHDIECVAYPTVYFSSDIHADVRKFIQMLRAVGLASMPDPVLDPYTVDIYDPRMISEVQWTGGRGTLLVIVGDLVDGKRGVGQIADPRGSFELLLLCYLYNLRIQARKQDSEVLYTIGNHDYLSIITNSDIDEFDEYIHLSALNDADDSFFATSAQRKNALRPFYALNPFFMLSFMNGVSAEMACVHGGLQNNIGNLAGLLKTYQSKIDTKITFGTIGTSLVNLPPILSAESTAAKSYMDGGAIWTRFYMSDVAGKCGPGVLESTYPFVVVGHCPTDSSARSLRVITENPARYPGCSVGGPGLGCVVTDCDSEHGPRLAFVDTAMSQAFHGADSSGRYAQFLKLTHTDTPSPRYYNKIESVTADPAGATARVLYDAAAPASGLSSAPAGAAVGAAVSAAVGGAGAPPSRRGRRRQRGGGSSTRKRHMRGAGGASTRRRSRRI
jgi:hypothetical protein